jgi:hypothetical protein
MDEFMPLLCDAKCAEHKKTKHKLLEKKTRSTYLVECQKCKGQSDVYFLVWEKARDKPWRGGLTRYPRIEPHTGALVKSPEHERETVKAMGFHEAPHGINHDYDDAISDRRTDATYED